MNSNQNKTFTEDCGDYTYSVLLFNQNDRWHFQLKIFQSEGTVLFESRSNSAYGSLMEAKSIAVSIAERKIDSGELPN